ncbi:MAG: TonB-dependent receptor, partial [Desulfobacterales bacterium]|nr:TonB-dependent receptor [Desulfobacterales bacterium]
MLIDYLWKPRSPCFIASYGASTGGATYGNPDLDPERSLFFEGGLHYDSSRLSVSGSLYLNNVDDLIAEQMVSPGL